MSDIIKKDSDATATFGGGKLVLRTTKFRQRVAEAQRDAKELQVNKLCLMLDRSSSMSGESIALLRKAVDNFVSRCNFVDTAIAIESFPSGTSLPLTSMDVIISTTVHQLVAGGDTPMHECVKRVSKLDITRGILVSDGCPTDWHSDSVLDTYIERKIPIDCVHIGDSHSGEERLRKIAELTGGLYLKFTDVSAFSTAFAYLTPGYRALLTSGKLKATELGASEVR